MPQYRYQIDRRRLLYDPSDAELAELLSAYGTLGRRVIKLDLIRATAASDKPCELVVVLEERVSSDQPTVSLPR